MMFMQYMYSLCAAIAMEREGGGGNIEVGQLCAGRPSMCTKCIPSRTHVSYKV